jgi:Beta-galactosidase
MSTVRFRAEGPPPGGRPFVFIMSLHRFLARRPVVLSVVGFCVALSLRAEPLDHVSAYSLEIGPEGPRPGYFPVGLRGGGLAGLPHKVVHAGFNVWQVQPDNSGFTSGAPFRDEGEPEGELHARYGYFYYTQARAMLALRRGSAKPPGQLGDYHFPPFIQEDGTPAKRGAPMLNIFDPSARRYFTDYMTGLASSSWGQKPVGAPTLFWGMDNEWEGRLDHSPEARAAYVEWLRTRFSGLDDINRTWGTRFESFEAIRDSALPKTDEFATRPGEFLSWHTFHAESFTNLLADAAQALHSADPHRRPVRYKSTQQTIEYPFVKRAKRFDHVLFGERARAFGGGVLAVNMYGAGDRQSYETSYIANIARSLDEPRAFHGVMCPEINNHSGPGHQWGATYWRVLSNGLKAANFFTVGYEGATGDYATFGHFGPDGRARDKMFYAARWAHMVHRTERLWTEAVPAPGVPRVAMLLPRRDVVLAERTDRRVSKWAYPMNHRVMVYGWLRERGYWVDVIPETKLDAGYLKKNYKALVLIGAEHLAEKESAAVADYVKAGGMLLADERAGHFDELHRERRSLEPVLGVEFGRYDRAARRTLGQGELRGVRVTGELEVVPKGAKVVLQAGGRALVTTHTWGKGRAIHLAFQTGDLREDPNLPVEVSTFRASGSNETADTGDASAPRRGGAIGRWLSGLLTKAGVAPAYRVAGVSPEEATILRVEQPMVDTRGNLVLTAAVRGAADPGERVPAFALELPLPGGPWRHAAWGAAEDADLRPIEVKPVGEGDLHRLRLPGVETAGVLYLFKDHPPLVGIPRIETPDRAIDGHAAKVRPATAFPVRMRLVNPSPATVPAGTLRLAALEGWNVVPANIDTPALAAGESVERVFTVTPAAAERLAPNWLYPLVGRWSVDGEDRAIGAANVEVHLD